MKYLALVLSLVSTCFANAAEVKVCTWKGTTGFVFSTHGYTWGGDSFSTLHECVTALSATLLVFDVGQGKADGTLQFTDPVSGALSECQMTALQYPYTPPPADFLAEMERAYHGQSSITKVEPYQPYLNENLKVVCQ